MILDEKMIYLMPWGPFPPGQPVSGEAARGSGSKCFAQNRLYRALQAAQSVQVTPREHEGHGPSGELRTMRVRCESATLDKEATSGTMRLQS